MQVDSIIREIGDSASFLAMRANYGDTSHTAVLLRQNLADQISITIANMVDFSANIAGKLTKAIEHKPYGEFSEQVQSAIDAKLNAAIAVTQTTTGGKSKKGCTQKHKYPHTAMTQKDLDILQNPRMNLHTHITTVVHRLTMLGINNPHEQTYRWWVAFLDLM